MPDWKAIRTQWSYWEFWPFWFFYLPVFLYYGWLALRERSFFFFTTSNPSIDFGGMMGERKSDIFKLIPAEYCPKTILISSSRGDLTSSAVTLGYPLIVKPDIGERGFGVELIHSQEQLRQYAEKMSGDFLLQEYIEYPLELGVFYLRHPDDEVGKITSLVRKEFLKVKGDGVSTVQALLNQVSRARIQLDWDHPRFSSIIKRIPDLDEQVVVEPIGNHCRGTTFMNGAKEIDEKLRLSIDRLAKEIPGFHFGRFDLKCASYEDLRELRNFSILELNGAGAEPGHIYEPGYSIWEAYREICWHLDQLARISRANRSRGHDYCSFFTGIKKLLDIRAYNRRLSRK